MAILVDVFFKCDCGQNVEDCVALQVEDFLDEDSSRGLEDTVALVDCPYCERNHTIQIVNTHYGIICTALSSTIEVGHGEPYDTEFDDLESWYVEDETHYEILQNHLKSIRTLVKLPVSEDEKFSLNVMLYGYIVSAIEGFLAGIFIHKVTNSSVLIRKLVESDPELAQRTFSLKDIFKQQETLQHTVAVHLKNLIFHRIDKVKPMYLQVLGCDLGNELGWLFKAITLRHHCAHRAGYDIDGNKIDVSEDSILELLALVEELADLVDSSISKLDIPNDGAH